MFKKFSSAFLGIFTLLSLSSCLNKQEKQVALLMAEVNPTDSIVGRMDMIFAEKAEELSNGSIKINLQASGILGKEEEVLKIITQPGSPIQLARASANLSNLGSLKSKLITTPFTFSNSEHFWKFAESEVAQEILNDPYEKNLGVKGLFYAHEGFRHIFSVSKINNLDDMKNKKVRVSNSKNLKDLMQALKAEPVLIDYSDLYGALQTGKADAADQPLSNYYSNGFHVVAPNIILDGHMLGAVQVIINSDAWNSLSDNQKKALTEAGKFAADFCHKTVDSIEQETLKKLKEEGVTVVEVNDIKPWQEACSEIISEASKDNPELYKKILDMAE